MHQLALVDSNSCASSHLSLSFHSNSEFVGLNLHDLLLAGDGGGGVGGGIRLPRLLKKSGEMVAGNVFVQVSECIL